MTKQFDPPEAFNCPQCNILLMPPVCPCDRGRELLLQCPLCDWQGRGFVGKNNPTLLLTEQMLSEQMLIERIEGQAAIIGEVN